MRRFIPFLLSIAAFCLAVTSVQAASPRDAVLSAIDRFDNRPVTQAELLAWSSEFLYGPLSANPLFVQDYDQFVRSLAKSTGALEFLGVDHDASLTSHVLRCDGVEALFALADITPSTQSDITFRDVQQSSRQRVIAQVRTWDAMTPRTATYFGCDVAMTSSELASLLRSIHAQYSLPLALKHVPTGVAFRTEVAFSASSVEQRRQLRLQRKNVEQPRTSPASTIQISPEQKKGKVTVGASIDRGSRSSSKLSSFPPGEALRIMWTSIKDKFLHQDRIITEDFYNDLRDKLAKVLLQSLEDEHSVYMPPQQAQSFQEGLGGEFQGIGARVEMKNMKNGEQKLVVVSPLQNSPAMRVGIEPGDFIIEVDDESVVSTIENPLSIHDIIAKIKGPEGTEVVLTIDRDGNKKTITVVRAKIVVPEIEYTTQDGIPVIRLMQFGQKTEKDLEEALAKAVATDPIGIILDLRNNPGGFLHTAVDVLGHFLPQGTVVVQIESARSTRQEKTQRAVQVVPTNLPIVVLVNKGSASASEIVAGALQDYDRATVMGVTTFGKGTVQEVIRSTANWAFKITTANWLTGKLLREIEGKGIDPDVEVKVDPEQDDAKRDIQLQEAVRYLQVRR